jgi:hypothetical protein
MAEKRAVSGPVRLSVLVQVVTLLVGMVAFLVRTFAAGVPGAGAGTGAIVVALLVSAFWILVARATWQGKNWARILQTVLLSAQLALAIFFAITGQLSYDTLDVLVVAMSGVAVILLWIPTARRYFADISAARRLARNELPGPASRI